VHGDGVDERRDTGTLLDDEIGASDLLSLDLDLVRARQGTMSATVGSVIAMAVAFFGVSMTTLLPTSMSSQSERSSSPAKAGAERTVVASRAAGTGNLNGDSCRFVFGQRVWAKPPGAQCPDRMPASGPD